MSIETAENVTIINNAWSAERSVRQGIDDRAATARVHQQDRMVEGLTVALQARKNADQLEVMKARANELAYRRNQVIAASNAASDTIAHLVKEMAELKGLPVEEVIAQVNKVRTDFYNKEVDNQLCTGHMIKDPRQDPEVVQSLKWYAP